MHQSSHHSQASHVHTHTHTHAHTHTHTHTPTHTHTHTHTSLSIYIHTYVHVQATQVCRYTEKTSGVSSVPCSSKAFACKGRQFSSAFCTHLCEDWGTRGTGATAECFTDGARGYFSRGYKHKQLRKVNIIVDKRNEQPAQFASDTHTYCIIYTCRHTHIHTYVHVQSTSVRRYTKEENCLSVCLFKKQFFSEHVCPDSSMSQRYVLFNKGCT